MGVLSNETYQIIDTHGHCLTDPSSDAGEAKLEADKGDDDQIWKTGTTLSNTTLISGMLLYLNGEAKNDGKVTCVASSDSASNWSLTTDSSDNTTVELLDASGKSLSPGLYLIPTADDRKAKVSQNKQTWKFNKKAVKGNGGTA